MYDELTQLQPTRSREWAELRLDALNHALRDIPEDRVRYHVCFGSWHVPHVADAPLEAVVDLVGRENVIAGTDCGFAQSEHIQRVHPQVMWAKLESLAEGARLATQDLWGH